jgi:hypothetical protein
MAGEVFSHLEGNVWLWTGTAGSALIAYLTDTDISMVHGVENYRTFDSAYHNLWTGQRADIAVGALYTVDRLTLQVWFDAKTAVHVHIPLYNSAGGSAGFYYYTGALDSLRLNGRENDLYRWSLQYHANVWSAY